ncbi:MAG: hypothetical protein EAZ61_04085 [Oscillatoriales cyanobacterium]|nr:MAG: hypothetical protein EAZ61_04085 [Oscillatoriales cyanobacterium]
MVLSAILVVTIYPGAPRVRSFSWADRSIRADDRQFSLTFSHTVDHDSIAANLQIRPALPGQITWDDRTLIYTLDNPAPYGFDFSLSLTGGHLAKSARRQIQPFQAQFKSADRAIAYIGTEADERGRLVLYNFTQDKTTILTPPDLSVMDYHPYFGSEKLLFSAIDRTAKDQRLLDVQLYSVTTGLNGEPPGRLTKILDDSHYQTLQFDLAAQAETIVVQRADRQNPGANFGLWLIRGGETLPIQAEPGGLFTLTPDGTAIALSQREGIAILSLDPLTEPAQLIVFFPEFGRALDLSNDGQKLALLKFNPNYTQSIFLSVNQDVPQELITLTGTVMDAQFDPNGEVLYALLLDELDTETYQAQPQIVAIDLKDLTVRELARLDTDQRDLQFSLSPDGQAIIFDQLNTESPQNQALDTPRTPSGDVIVGGDLRVIVPLINLEPDSNQPSDTPALQPTIEPLGLAGIRPHWLP